MTPEPEADTHLPVHRTQAGPLRVLQVAQLPPEPSGHPAWLIDDLWAHQAVGVIGGAPKCCKTYLALEMALAVASGTPCLGRFPVHDPGPVLLFAAEDAPPQVRDRLRGLAHTRNVDFDNLPLLLILTHQLRLDTTSDKQRLADAVEEHKPRLLILDPFVRLHRADENSATEISALLADLRALQRRFHLAILLVHHTRKGNGPVAGQALRGSSDLHAWGDSNLYLKKADEHIRLTAEHRAARTPDPITLQLHGEPAHLRITTAQSQHQETNLNQQVLNTLTRHSNPMTQAQLRDTLKIRNQSLTTALRHLREQNMISRTNGAWTLSSQTSTPQRSKGSNQIP